MSRVGIQMAAEKGNRRGLTCESHIPIAGTTRDIAAGSAVS